MEHPSKDQRLPIGVMYISANQNHVYNQNIRETKNIPPLEPSHAVRNSATKNDTGMPPAQKWTLGRDAQNLLENFNKKLANTPGLFYAVQLDEENHVSNIFWTDARSRTAYHHFGDAVTLDTRYKVNQYRVPFVPFTGVNHHGQMILFGCALLSDDSEASFLWLLKTFLTSMNNREPVSIITGQDKAIQSAVSQVFLRTRHCISKWHVWRECQEKLAHVCHAHPNFQVEIFNCINLTETIEEFESSWNSILDKYGLRRNDLLQSLYDARAKWVPAYFRDSFFAKISTNSGLDRCFFDGCVNQQTTLPMFLREYEGALWSWFEKETEADFETTCTTPVFRTPSPMEKQAASLYTRKIFSLFQEELVDTFAYTANRIIGDEVNSTFRVAKFEDDQKAYVVTLNHLDLRATCSCKMFEYSGILCRHVLTVFKVTNVLTLPTRYILRRWTRNAKIGVGSDERAGELHEQESLTSGHSNLCKEAISYAEEGAVAVETYNVASSALKERGKKIAAVKLNVAKVAPPYHAGDDRKASTSISLTTPLLWPQNAVKISRFDQQDEGPSDVMKCRKVVLPCLKSFTLEMDNKNLALKKRVVVINLKLQDYSKTPSAESEVKFQFSGSSLALMFRSIVRNQALSPVNKFAIINLKLQDTDTTSGESEVKIQVSWVNLNNMLLSLMSIFGHGRDTKPEPVLKRPRE